MFLTGPPGCPARWTETGPQWLQTEQPASLQAQPAFLRESLTYDRGSEMACHQALAKRLNIDIWFADPHAPWHLNPALNTEILTLPLSDGRQGIRTIEK